MNRCRRLLAITAVLMASRGISTYVLDVPGTGDTPLPFREARWELWKNSIIKCFRYINTIFLSPTYVAGLRLGAVLALDALGDITTIIAINPVDGSNLTRTLLRTKAVSSQESRYPVTLTELQNTLAKGETVEAAGYALSPELAQSVNAARLPDHLPSNLKVVDITGSGPPLWLQNEPQQADELAIELAMVLMHEIIQ